MKTMGKFCLTFLTFLLIYSFVEAQSQKLISASSKPYAVLWKQVDSLTRLGQPKSALAKAAVIYDLAKKNRNEAEFVKAVLYKIRLNSDFQEDFLVNTIGDLNTEIKDAREPATRILQSVLAEVYWKYYQNNQFRFRDRTQVKENKSDSVMTWDLNTLSANIFNTYMLSLENPELLKSMPIQAYEVILDEQDNYPFRPTLYDFLSWRALDFFMTARVQKNTSPDSLNPDDYALKIFANLAAFHAGDKDPHALVDLELKRLDFIHEISTLADKDSLYFSALQQLEKKYSSSSCSADISYTMANFLYQQGQNYRPLDSEKHRFDLKSAAMICETTLGLFPESEGTKNCKILLASIKQPGAQLTLPYALPIEKTAPAFLSFKNLKRLYFRIIKAEPEDFSEKTGSMSRPQLLAWLLPLPALKTWELNLPEENDYQQHSLEINIPELSPGFYVLLGTSDKSGADPDQMFTYVAFWSTQFSYISQRNDKGGIDFYLVDRENGNLLSNVEAEAWVKNYNYNSRHYESKKVGDFKTDKDGFFSIPPLEAGARFSNLYLKIRQGGDLFYTENFYQYPLYIPTEIPEPKTFFFTDRAIYRPGQTIYFKGILLKKTADDYAIMAGQLVKVVLNDVNGQKISEQSFTTSEFGSFNGSFVAPSGVLTGQMSISNGSGSVYFRVEEYKRPAFEVSFKPLEGNYRLGEKINVSGNALAYAGNSIEGAKVGYRVVRTVRFPWWSRGWYCPTPASPEMEITNGFTLTDKDGNFSVEFTAIPDLSVDKSTLPVFNYMVYADVTDINGETQSAEETVSAGYRSLLLGLDLPEKLNPLTDSVFTVKTTNLNGRPTPALVNIVLYRLEQPEHAYRSRLWERPDAETMGREEFYALYPHDIYEDDNNPETWEKTLVFAKAIQTRTDSVLNFRTGPTEIKDPGFYQLILKSTDPFGETVEKKTFLTVFHPDAKEIPVNSLCWFTPLNTAAEPGEKAGFLIGTSEDQLKVLFEIRVHDSLWSRTWLDLSQEQKLIEVPVLDSYRGNFSVNFISVKYNRAFQNTQLVKVPYTDKKLNITFETFRNKLEPGQKEEWKIRISGPGKKPVGAELLACMYDASLDAFQENHWSFDLYRRYYSLASWEAANAFRTATSTTYVPDLKTGDLFFRQFYQLNWFGLNYFGGRPFPLKRGMADQMMLSDERSPSMSAKGENPDIKDAGLVSEKTTALPEVEETNAGGHKQTTPGIQIRRDFRETAFFYPSLMTDTAGNIILKFTAPESLTRWRFMGLAYNRRLETGYIGKELVTRKELMVFPNAPRFVRQGDTLIFSTKVVDLSGKAGGGTLTLSLQDPVSLKNLDYLALNSPTRQFAGASTVVSWKIYIPNDPGLTALQYRVTAVAGSFSDGEEKVIPVLSNRMLVTETLPLPVLGKGTFGFSFDKLLNSGKDGNGNQTLKNFKVTLEFASNPAWYAIQALPSLNEKKYSNADAIFAAFYANSIASFIVHSNPRIRAVFESWSALTPQALLSNLVKNQDLKSAMLQETPWVLEATNESERKQKMGQYFDVNTLSACLQENLDKIRALQSPNGAWPWFEGMTESRYITQNIVAGLGHLAHMGVIDLRKDQTTGKMVEGAVLYLDGELRKDFEYLKKYYPGKLDENHLGSTQIQYLYARSFFPGIPVKNAGNKEAMDYYRAQSVKYWLSQDKFMQGMIALSLKRSGNAEIPGLIVKSLSEKSLHSGEMGMYWALEQGWRWYQAPVETQALMIEVFDEVAGDNKAVEDLKIWLLKQKQTQDWRTPRATAEAVYALLLKGKDFLADNPGVKIKLGKETVDPDKLLDNPKEAGTGYFQLSWTGEAIHPEMGKIEVSKSTEGLAWGSVYWQYFENMDKITPAATPLKIEKQLFVERNTPAGPVLVALGAGGITGAQANQPADTLKVGDRLKVRIILTADREMEFVHMKDLRASAFEPVDVLSGYHYQDGLGYYQSVTDAAMNFFFDNLPKGVYVFEYPLKVNAAGDYSNGITTIQCMYAPEFSAHSEGIRVIVR